jgi:hypothetical protein
LHSRFVGIADWEEQGMVIAGAGGTIPPVGRKLGCELEWARSHPPSLVALALFAKTNLVVTPADHISSLPGTPSSIPLSVSSSATSFT